MTMGADLWASVPWREAILVTAPLLGTILLRRKRR